MNQKTLEERAEEIGKNYKKLHILVRFVMLYHEVAKIPYFIEYLKGNLENQWEYIPFLQILLEQTLDEVKCIPENIKYISSLESLYSLTKVTDFDIEKDFKENNHLIEQGILNMVKVFKEKLYSLIQLEKNNFSIELFNIWKEKDVTKTYIDLFLQISSQKENLLL